MLIKMYKKFIMDKRNVKKNKASNFTDDIFFILMYQDTLYAFHCIQP